MRRLVPILVLLAAAVPAAASDAVVNGFRMHFEDTGRGQAVVFLHAFTLDSRMWEEQRPLAATRRTIAPDMRFHGRSAAPEDSAFDLAEAAADVVALLDYLKVPRAHLVGLSMGGGYALETALRYPDRVRSLTLASSSIQGIHTPPEAMVHFSQGVELYAKEGAAGFRRAWLADPLFAEASRRPEVKRRLEAMVGSYNVDALFRIMGKVKPAAGPTQLERLPQVKAPTLVLIGGRDQPHIIQAGEEAATAIRGARKIVYPEAGHLINMEQPQQFNRDLEDFLTSHATP